MADVVTAPRQFSVCGHMNELPAVCACPSECVCRALVCVGKPSTAAAFDLSARLATVEAQISSMIHALQADLPASVSMYDRRAFLAGFLANFDAPSREWQFTTHPFFAPADAERAYERWVAQGKPSVEATGL